jgi:RNA polymerase sigma-70 factor (ECF subfamily)
MTTRRPDFREVHVALRPRVLRYLARMAGEAEAEDLAQEVFEKVSRSLGDFRGDAELSTWVYRIATNTALDRLRRRGKPADSVDPSVAEYAVAAEGDRDVWTDEIRQTLEGRVIRDEMNACIREVIYRLPENYRTVIILGDLEGFSDREIAQILGLNLRNAKVRLHRARVQLREALEKACVFYRSEDNELACDRREPFPTFATDEPEGPDPVRRASGPRLSCRYFFPRVV